MSRIKNITLDSAVKVGDELLFGIEQCFCPSEYDGPSCSKCADGYTRQGDGSCGKCDCLGKSEKCDGETGECRNCTDNTQGILLFYVKLYFIYLIY